MPAVSIAQIPALTADLGLKFTAKAWGEIPEEFLSLARVIPIAECTDAPFGTIGSSISSGAEPLRRKDGAPIQESGVAQDYVIQGAVRIYSRKMGITQRDMEGENAQSVLEGKIAKWQKDFVRNSKLQRAQLYADILVNGSLTAGHQATFDNSYDNGARPDPHPLFGYDGAPVFGTHTAKHSLRTYSNYGTNVLAAAGLDATRTAMNKTNAFDENGKRVSILMDTIVIPQELQYTADQLIDSSKDPSNANGGSNPFQGKLRRVVLPQLTDTDGWYGLVAGQGIAFIDGGMPTFETMWDSTTKTTWIIGELRYGGFLEEWRYLYANRTPQS